MGIPFSVQTGTVKIVERFGKYSHVAHPGLNWLMCCTDGTVGPISLKLEEMRVQCKTKTKDDVFILIQVSVQYQILPQKVYDAYYKLSKPKQQIEAFVFDVVRSEVPKATLDEIFVLKEKLQNKIREQLRENMSQFGYQIIAAPVTNIDPDASVKAAMNAKQTEVRRAEADETRARSEKVDKILRAEAEAEKIRIEAQARADQKYLQGQGLSRQRTAIIEGLQDSVTKFKEGMPEVETTAVMDLILLTQYLDTLKDIGCANNSSTVFVPSNPSCVKDIVGQMRQGILEGNAATHAIAAVKKSPAKRAPLMESNINGNNGGISGLAPTTNIPARFQ